MKVEEYKKLLEKRNRGKVAPSEHDLQVACVKLFRLQYPQYANLLFAIPNGGQRNLLVAAKLKAEGVLSGVPDLFLAVPSGEHNGLFIEMKNGRSNSLTANQKLMFTELRNQNYRCECVHDMVEFEKTIKEYLGK